jgi:hypothetical protein
MANTSTPRDPRYTGFFRNEVGNTLDLYHEGTRVMAYSAASGAGTGAQTATTTVAAGTTVTAGTGMTATTGDLKGTTGNLRLGVVSTFLTTQPTSAVVMKSGTAPEGAITTSGSIQSTDTIVTKCIADGTVDNIET